MLDPKNVAGVNSTPARAQQSPRIASLIPAEPGWVATVYFRTKDDDGRGTVTGTGRHRVHGWALVERDGVTDIEAMYVESPGFPTTVSLRNSYAPDHAEVYVHFDPDADDLTEPRVHRAAEAPAPEVYSCGYIGNPRPDQIDPEKMLILATVRFTQTHEAQEIETGEVVHVFRPGDTHVHASVRTWHPQAGNDPRDPRNEWETTPDDGGGCNPCQASVTIPGHVIEVLDCQAESL